MKAYRYASVVLSMPMLIFLVGCSTQPATPAGSVEPQVEGASSWAVILETQVEQPVRIAAFLNETIGFTGGEGDEGKTHYTTDGGQSWTMAESSTDCVFSLDIIDTHVVWQCSSGPVRVSIDSGHTWTPVTGFSNFCKQLSFLDARTGWVMNPREVAKTTDGGQTWSALPLPDRNQDVAAIFLRTPTDGYVLDLGRTLYATQDGGTTWSAHPLEVEMGTDMFPNADTATAAIHFFDADRGLVLMQIISGDHGRVIALRTTDGGQTWKQEHVVDTPLFISLYLANDGKTLTMVDKDEAILSVLRDRGE